MINTFWKFFLQKFELFVQIIYLESIFLCFRSFFAVSIDFNLRDRGGCSG